MSWGRGHRLSVTGIKIASLYFFSCLDVSLLVSVGLYC